MPITSPGNDDDTGENHQPTLRKNTAEPVEQTLKQNTDAVQAVSEQTAQVSANVAAVQSVADSISESKAVVESHANEALTAIDEAVKSVKDKASDATGDDKAETTGESTPDTTDAAADGSQEA